MMDFFNDYRKLYLSALGLFVLLTTLVALMPAVSNQANNSPLTTEEALSGAAVKGAFPPLKGSAILLDDNPELLIDIVMNGYDARPEFASLPGIGTNMKLTAAEVAAIINHERGSWGNNARKVPVEEVQKIMDSLKQAAKK